MNMTASIRRIAITALCAAVGTACAKAYAPPGGTQDRTPPRLVESSPAALSTRTQFDGPVVFTFDETLAEQGITNATVVVSPQPRGRVEVDRKGERIEVRSESGWLPNQVYRILIRPGIADRFGNRRTDAVELVFSTGAPIQNTAFAGVVTDRITGRIVADAAIEAIRRADSAVYTAGTDTAGFFALRSVPAGVYDVTAYADGNRNRRRDASEARSVAQELRLGETDTIASEFVLIPADTTGPRLTDAAMLDSMHVVLTFDDFIDESTGLAGATTVVQTSADSTLRASGSTFTVRNVFTRSAARAPGAQAPRTGADSARAGNARPDSAAAPGAANAARAAADAARGGRGRAGADTLPRADREVVVRLNTPLQRDTRYRVIVTGVRNVNGLTGGGTAAFTTPPAPATPPRAPGGVQESTSGSRQR